MNARQERGIQLAETVRIHSVNKGVVGVWIVPSATSAVTKYTVNLNSDHRCTCPDFELRRCNCKHYYAVMHFVRKQQIATTNDKGVTTVTETETKVTVKKVKKTYRQDWPAYNSAQCVEKNSFQILLHDLCKAIPEPPQESGRKRVPMADQVFSAAFKVYSTVSARRFTCDIQDAAAKGYVAKAPHYNSILKYMEDESLTPILHSLIERSAAPLKGIEQDFAVDSTGFSGSKFDTWSYVKYNADRLDFVQHCERADWVKLHLMCGVKTNIVTSVEVTGRDVNDTTQFKPLVKKAAEGGFTMREVSADKAYLSTSNLRKVAEQKAVPYIPFKVNSVGEDAKTGVVNAKGTDLWLHMWPYFTYHTDTFMEHYHKRSNVESVFSMIKAKFGNCVRSKTRTAQINEVLLKVLCHNICCVIQSIHELGIEADFKGRLN